MYVTQTHFVIARLRLPVGMRGVTVANDLTDLFVVHASGSLRASADTLSLIANPCY